MNRRAFVHSLGLGTLGTLAAFDRPQTLAASELAVLGSADASARGAPVIRLANNENPYGPGPLALEAVSDVVSRAHRYPRVLPGEFVSAIARAHDVPPEHILISGGSGDVMRAAVYAFTSRTKGLVMARPSYEAPMRSAQHVGSPVIRVPLTPDLRPDVRAMAARSVGAGLVYVCNPNNPTSSAVFAEDLVAMIEEVGKRSPGTRILVDEAYWDYVEMDGFDTMIPLVAANPHLIVTRTFSKIHGMAGMRVAYAIAQPEAMKPIVARHSNSSLGMLSLAAATASLGDSGYRRRMVAMNRAVRAFVVDEFTQAGYQVAPPDANFVFVNIRRDARGFERACRLKGVHVGRAFPPMNTWARISVGTPDEMRAAMSVFMDVLTTPLPGSRPRPAASS